MKKWLALMTAFAMAAAMACHGETETEPTQEPTVAPESSSTPTPAPVITSTPEATATATATPEVTATATPEDTAAPTATATAAPEVTATAAPEVTATPEVTSAPEVTATPEATSAPEVTTAPAVTATPEGTTTPEITATPGVTATPEGTSTPEVTATPEVTPTPEVSVTPTPTVDPEATVTPGPTDTPVAIPESVGPESPVEDILLVQEWLLKLEYLTEEQQTGVYDEDTQAAVTLFQTEMNEKEQAALEVTGLCDRATLELMYQRAQSDTPQQPEAPGGNSPGGGRPSGGFGGSGSRPSGSSKSSGTAGSMTVQPDLSATGGVTPGEAVTSSHASGTQDTSAYGSVEVTSIVEASDTLIFGEAVLDVTLTSTNPVSVPLAFTASLSEDASALTLDGAEGDHLKWSVDGMALRALDKSGVGTLTLIAGGVEIALPTQSLLTGEGYDNLRKQGVTDNTLVYIIELEQGEPTFAVMTRDEICEAVLESSGPLILTGVSISPIS